MTLEIRPIRDEEMEEFVFANLYAFNEDRRPNAVQNAVLRAQAVPLEWSLAAFVDGRLAAGLRALPLTIRIGGAELSMAGVSGVACLPEYRRRGYVGALLKRALEDMRERGQVLSALYTPHIALYRRYGWEIAARNIRYSFNAKDVKTIVPPPTSGRIRRVTVDEWPALSSLYEEYSAGRNCLIVRPEEWWRQRVFGENQVGRVEHPVPDAAVWEDGEDRPRGYVVYSTRVAQPPDRPWPESRLWVRELVTQDPQAYVALVNYLLAHDIHDRIEMSVPPDEPLLSLLDDPHRVRIEAWSSLMLRIVDAPAALRARGCSPEADGRRFTLAVRDRTLPWNEGAWRVEAKDNSLRVEPHGGAADLSLDATVLAPIFNGYLSVREAARSGLLEVGNDAALEAAAAVFSVSRPPFCLDYF
jgi:predicted acetyltransferase